MPTCRPTPRKNSFFIFKLEISVYNGSLSYIPRLPLLVLRTRMTSGDSKREAGMQYTRLENSTKHTATWGFQTRTPAHDIKKPIYNERTPRSITADGSAVLSQTRGFASSNRTKPPIWRGKKAKRTRTTLHKNDRVLLNELVWIARSHHTRRDTKEVTHRNT